MPKLALRAFIRPVLTGTKWGVIAAGISALCAPIALELDAMLTAVLLGNQWRGLLGGLDPAIWGMAAIGILAFVLLPTVTGCVALSILLQVARLPLGLKKKAGFGLGVLIGPIVLLFGIIQLLNRMGLSTDRSAGFWILPVFYGIIGAATFGWIGYHLPGRAKVPPAAPEVSHPGRNPKART